MTTTLKKKTSFSSLEEYMNYISKKCEEKIHIVKKPLKISDENLIIPTINTYNDIMIVHIILI